MFFDRCGTIARCCLLLLVLSSAGVFGHADDVLEDPWRWSHFTDDDGLPAPSALRVKESANGVLWAATANGLDWFDGYQWHPVTDTPGAPPNQFTGSINTPASGGVAVGASGSVYVGDQSGFETIAIPGETIDFSAVTPDGDFVLLTRESGLYLWREGIVEPMSPPEGVESTGINHLGASDDGTVWLSCASDGRTVWRSSSARLYRLEEKRWVLEQQGQEMAHFVISDDGRRFASASLPFEDRGLWSWREGEQPQRVSASQEIVTYTDRCPHGQRHGI